MESIKLLTELVSINSVFPNERALAEYLELHLIELGFSVQRVAVSEGRFNIIAERGTRGKPIAFYGHMDTVPVYGEWKGSPFEVRTGDAKKEGATGEGSGNESDRLYGLGTCDMKAGIAAILKACEPETDRRIKIAFGVDEENISEGAYALAASGFFSDCEGVVVTEAGQGSDGNTLGPKMITVGRRGHAVYELLVPGRSSHGAQVSLGVNAIHEAARLVLALDSLVLPAVPEFPPASQFISRISGESTSLSIPDIARVELDRHTVPPETAESVLATLRAFIDHLYATGQFKEIGGQRITVRLKERKTPYLNPYHIDRSHPFVQRIAESIRTHYSTPPVYNCAASVADENVFAALGLPVVTIGPVGGNEHAANEWVSRSSYLELIEILKRCIGASQPGE